MRVRLILALVDRPGVLLKALEQIAVNGGNIISIIHNRDGVTSGYVPVSINVDFPDAASLERAKKGIEAAGIPVMAAETLEKIMTTALLIGRVKVEEVLKKVEEAGSRVSGLSLISGLEAPCLKLLIEVLSGKMGQLSRVLEEFARERDAVLVLEG